MFVGSRAGLRVARLPTLDEWVAMTCAIADNAESKRAPENAVASVPGDAGARHGTGGREPGTRR